ncbi:MAG: ABC transporter, permease protein 2 (cluster 1, maltose/g3p/polyamine/iron) [uncultured Thermomicrobiales bacterium]|uniref:ABC transporter, permease protein 2 (Cluster 1, maltose/g3p/polyamine/iron) n=1 Tax=uncultured Thermomicrobiales bacterium TaxID=1645740 RepID=A0A6J4U746_9BACT|nr:MAG: ABC transporter, permease protein 2 (cluster 1, maltose/g3p/polyamine/iron) [uncultured Thermomicrobiales bacterium]
MGVARRFSAGETAEGSVRRGPGAAAAVRRALAYLILGLGMVVAIGPFLVTVLASVKTPIELVKGIFALPEVWRWGNYEQAWTTGHLGRFFVNSLIVAVGVVVPSLFLSAMSGYAFARFRFRGSAVLFGYLMLGLVVPLQAMVIPLFYLMRSFPFTGGNDWSGNGGFGLLNSHWALILPQVAMSVSFGTLMMRQAFLAIPREIVEASIVDGAGSWNILWRIMFPLTRPMVGTLALMFFIWTWNEFLLPLVVNIDPQYHTLPLGLLYFQAQWTAQVPIIAAGATIIFLPLTVVFLLFQRQLVRGITAGAVKG